MYRSSNEPVKLSELLLDRMKGTRDYASCSKMYTSGNKKSKILQEKKSDSQLQAKLEDMKKTDLEKIKKRISTTK